MTSIDANQSCEIAMPVLAPDAAPPEIRNEKTIAECLLTTSFDISKERLQPPLHAS